MRFLEAKHHRQGRSQKVRVIVIHTMEAPKDVGRAWACANYFANVTKPEVSAHYCVDNKEVVQCVKDEDAAWHAGPANAFSVGIELSGYAKQTPDEWKDAYNTAMLKNAADLVRSLCKKYGIPMVRLTPAQLKAGASGIVGHVDVNSAFGKGDHTDPGRNFPWDRFMSMVRGSAVALGGGALAGAAAGFLVGGPVGAAAGAGLGFITARTIKRA